MEDDQLLTVTCGLPPANASVVRILSVRAPIWLLDAVHLIVVGLFTLLNCAMGNWLALLLPMVNVTGPQLLMRESEGCMCPILSALSKPEGVPSTVPIAQIVDGCEREDFNVRLVVPPAETDTCGSIELDEEDAK